MIKCPNCGSENLVYKGGATYMCTDCAEVTTFVIPYDDSREKVPVELVYEENKKLRELLKLMRSKIKEVYDFNKFEFEIEGIFTKEDIMQIDQILADNKIQASTVACNKIQENKR